jgi:hypothetical protein
MAGMRAEEAEDFYEEDEDPARMFVLFDAAEKGRTAPPQDHASPDPDLTPLRVLLREVGTQLRQDVRELELRERLVVMLRHAADSLEQHSKV